MAKGSELKRSSTSGFPKSFVYHYFGGPLHVSKIQAPDGSVLGRLMGSGQMRKSEEEMSKEVPIKPELAENFEMVKACWRLH